ncbi:uncharacterized protein LOC120838707, partial [Ixodes scapularis]|uniref:uncharacterized protein LOC120838707 n=1 Tax=Ixodes scapularis TaxID=6945 RepID=UPI001C391BB8
MDEAEAEEAATSSTPFETAQQDKATVEGHDNKRAEATVQDEKRTETAPEVNEKDGQATAPGKPSPEAVAMGSTGTEAAAIECEPAMELGGYWETYVVRVEAYFEGNAIAEDKRKRALLVAALGSRPIGILCGICAPRRVNELTYKDVVGILGRHYAPKPNEIAESYKFLNRQQREGESVQDFIVELRKIAENCNFGDSLDRMLRDRIVCGVRNQTVQRQLLARRDLTFAEAEDLATAAEVATKEVKNMESQDVKNEAELHRMAGKSRKQSDLGRRYNTRKEECERCGSSSHARDACRHRFARCFRCGRQSHFAKKCGAHHDVATAGRPSSTIAAATASGGEDLDLASVYTVQPRTRASFEPSFRRQVSWGGVRLTMEVDTGSPVCVIPRKVYNEHKDHWPALSATKLSLRFYLGQLPILGELHMRATVHDVTVPAPLVVVNCPGPSLCGRDVIGKLNTLDPLVSSVVAGSTRELEDLLLQFQDLFEPGLGTI